MKNCTGDSCLTHTLLHPLYFGPKAQHSFKFGSSVWSDLALRMISDQTTEDGVVRK